MPIGRTTDLYRSESRWFVPAFVLIGVCPNLLCHYGENREEAKA